MDYLLYTRSSVNDGRDNYIPLHPAIKSMVCQVGRNHKIGFKGQKPLGLIQIELQSLQKKVTELEEQMSNVAKNSYRREQNRKSNIRREVRDYLAELRTKK